MSELDLYKFINKNKVEWHWSNDGTEVYAFISTYLIDDFYKLFNRNCGLFEEEGLECYLKDGYFAIKMLEICEYFGFDSKKIFDKDEEY